MRHILPLVLGIALVLLSACSPSAPMTPKAADSFTQTAVDNINLFVQGVRSPATAMKKALGYIPRSLSSQTAINSNALDTQALINLCPAISWNEKVASIDFAGKQCEGKIGDTSVDFSGKITFSGTPFQSFQVTSQPAVSLELREGNDFIRGQFDGSMALSKQDAGMRSSIKAGYKLEGNQIKTLAANYDLTLNINKPSLFDSAYNFSGTVKYSSGNTNYTAQVSTPQPLEVKAFDFCAGPSKGALQFKIANDVIDVVYKSCNAYDVSLNGKVIEL